MTYYIKAILLKDCNYSNNTLKLLEYYKIPNKIIYINNYNKELFKYNDINTFPQIYLKKKNNKGHLLLGGYTELNNLINDIINNKNIIDDSKLNNLINKYKWSKIAIIKFIDLINY